MQSEIIFISDLHIALEKPDITNNFLLFLKSQIGKSCVIYILGDLFDVWIGDDNNIYPNNKIKAQLKRLTNSGVKIFLQSGNRDFLIGAQFCTETGIRLLADYAVINLNGVDTLLTHGDLLCTHDVAYQEFRKKSHTVRWKQKTLSKPLLIRLLVARWYRFRSYFHKSKKTPKIMDVSQKTVIDVMQKNNCYRLIHGHTHRPAIHNFTINQIPAQRFVLADWDSKSGQILRWNATGYRIETIG